MMPKWTQNVEVWCSVLTRNLPQLASHRRLPRVAFEMFQILATQ